MCRNGILYLIIKTDKVSHWYFCMLQYWLYLSIHTAHSPNHRGLHESLLWEGYRLEAPSRIISWPPKKDQLRLQHRIVFVRFCQTLSLLPLSSQVRKYKDANLRMNASSHSCWPHHGHRKHFPRPPSCPAQKMLRFHTSRSSAFYDVVRVTFTSPGPHPRRPPQGVFKSPTCLQKPSAKVAPGPELLSLTCLDSISMSFVLHFLHFMLSTQVYKRDDVTLRERKVALHSPSLSVWQLEVPKTILTIHLTKHQSYHAIFIPLPSSPPYSAI